MSKADDDKLVRYFFTIAIAGLLLLIFSGLRNIFSYVVFAGFALAFLTELIKAMIAGIEVN